MRIQQVFDALLSCGKKALIPYITAGDPELAVTEAAVLAMDQAGADIIELGVPYSDPLADGAVIQRATQRALEAGTNIHKVFDLVESLQGRIKAPLALLVYFNPVYQYGIGDFIAKCAAAGVAGLIIPDLPLEERTELQKTLEDKGRPLDLIPLVAPTSRERIAKVVTGATGFVYAISSKGVTGVRKQFAENLESFIGQVRAATNLPVALGFGIGDVETVAKIKHLVDGVILGSVLVQMIESAEAKEEAVEQISSFIRALRSELG